MPSKTPAKGAAAGPAPRKQLSGAQKRRQAKERALKAGTADSVKGAPTVADFDRLEHPPLDNPSAAIAWANNLVLIALHQVAHHPGLTCQERWRHIKELVAVQGMVRDKAETQHLLKELKKQLRQTKEGGGTEPVKPGDWQPPEQQDAPGDRPPDAPAGGTPG